MTETESLLPEHAILACEFDSWQTRNPGRIYCEGREVTEDGRLVFDLSIGATKFRLLCPVDYPNHEDGFLMETECADFWFIAVNEFIVDYPGKLTIDDILAKTFFYYTPSSGENSADDDSAISETENESDNETEDCRCADNAEWESAISKKKKEWREKEGELRLKYNRPKISDMFDGVAMEHPQQVFSNSAASAILVNDLINIMGNKESGGIIVEPIESDICRWSVLLKNFTPESTMARDLSDVKELYGYEHVQLRLDFTMDLYPSHPPLLRLVKPKLTDVFDEKEFVRFANWNPARDMASVLKEIKDYIEANGAVDIYHRHNGIDVTELKKELVDLTDLLKSDTKKASDAHLQSSCTGPENSTWMSSECFNFAELSISSRRKSFAIETILARVLYQLKNVGNRTLSNSITKAERPIVCSYFTFNLSVNKNFFDEKNAQPTSKTSSSYSSLILDAINRFAENEKFKTHSCRLNLRSEKCYSDCERKNCNIITNPYFDIDYRSQNAVEIDNEKYSVNKVSGFLNDMYTAVISDTDESVKRRQRFVKRANDVISTFNANIKTSEGSPVSSSSKNSTKQFGSNENSSRVLTILRESNLISLIRSKLEADAFFEIWMQTSLHSKIIEIIIETARNQHLIDLLKPTNRQDRSIADLIEYQGKNVALIFALLSNISDGRTIKQADLDKVELAKNVIYASKLVLSKIETTNDLNEKSTDQILSDTNNAGIYDRSYPVNDSPESIYRNSLKHLQFRECDIDPKGHTFLNEYNNEKNSSSRNYFRIAQEFAFLSKTLPLSPTPVIFVVMDGTKCSLMRALIIGGEGACCSGGCFNFDIYLRKDYPDCRMEIKGTTFRGKESTDRLESGTVFLPFEEDVPNFDQAFLNMQFSPILETLTFLRNNQFPLVLTDGQNYRPNCENIGVTDGITSNEVLVTDIIRYSMIDQMRNPPPGFEEVVKTHFRLKKDRIISELIDKHEFLRNSEILHLLIEEFNHL